jgi:23S rRNA (uracil1939-C5)-methyltransferase
MIFAPYCIPGEVVRGKPVEVKPRWSRMIPTDWLKRSPERITARCLHFSTCGGCHYQHIAYQHQLEVKEGIVKDQLKRIGGFQDPPLNPMIPSPQAWEYRNHMRYQVLKDGRLGFMPWLGEAAFAIEACFLPLPELQDLWSRIVLPPSSSINQIGVRAGTDGDPMIIFHSESEAGAEVDLDFPASLIWQHDQTWRVLAGESALSFVVEGQTFQVSPPSFFQVNSGLLPELSQQVLECLSLAPGMRLGDLYAGVGFFSALAADSGVEVIAIETSSSACADFEQNLAAFEGISLYEAPVEMALPAVPANLDVVLLDPPRAGLSRPALDALLNHRAPRIVYLSCDLGTFARDAKRLQAGGYYLQEVTPIDLFPQTFHIETLSIWDWGEAR